MKFSTRPMLRSAALFCAVIATATLSGCASLSESECLQANWYAIGMEDGAKGKSLSSLGSHRRACADAGVSPDVDQYTAGRDEGLIQYCTAANGLDAGKRGVSYRGVCPADYELEFLNAYRVGKLIHTVRTEMAANSRAVTRIEKELGEEEVDAEKRASLAYDLRALERDFGRLQYQLEELEEEEQRIF